MYLVRSNEHVHDVAVKLLKSLLHMFFEELLHFVLNVGLEHGVVWIVHDVVVLTESIQLTLWGEGRGRW